MNLIESLLHIPIIGDLLYTMGAIRDVDDVWDKELNELLDLHEDNIRLHFTSAIVHINDIPIWVSNFPYAYGHAIADDVSMIDVSGIPKRKTALRLAEVVDRARVIDKLSKIAN